MKRHLTAALVCLLPSGLWAQDHTASINAVLDTHVLPRVLRLAEASETLAATAQNHCDAASPELLAAYHAAFDAWVNVGHLRFGPFEAENRAFALAFWPDSRGVTPRTLAALLDDADPVVGSAQSFATVSVAGRGFYAVEFLLFDPDLMVRGKADYRCALIQVMTVDIAATTAKIADDWVETHANLMRSAGNNDRYQSPAEAMRVLFNALTTGLEFNANVRLGRPLGTFDRPRPNRAEARRSQRSVHNLTVSMQGLADLATAMAPDLDDGIEAGFEVILAALARLENPTLSDVADIQGRFRVEVIQQRISELRQTILTEMGSSLGVSAGFNALDGD